MLPAVGSLAAVRARIVPLRHLAIGYHNEGFRSPHRAPRPSPTLHASTQQDVGHIALYLILPYLVVHLSFIPLFVLLFILSDDRSSYHSSTGQPFILYASFVHFSVHLIVPLFVPHCIVLVVMVAVSFRHAAQYPPAGLALAAHLGLARTTDRQQQPAPSTPPYPDQQASLTGFTSRLHRHAPSAGGTSRFHQQAPTAGCINRMHQQAASAV
jgi:hypothetical protein